MINANGELNDIPEIKIGVYRFEVRGSWVFCMLIDSQVTIMESFFKRIEVGDISWESAKEETLNELIKVEFKNCPDHLLDHFKKSSRSASVFFELEKAPGIQSLIKSINRDFNLGNILD